MRKTVAVAAVLLVSGCAGGARAPVRVSGSAPGAAGQALDCASNQLEGMGYTSAPISRTATSVTGVRRNDPPWYLKTIGYRETADQITATANGGQLTVTAVSTDPGAEGTAASGATASTRRDAERLLGACSRG